MSASDTAHPNDAPTGEEPVVPEPAVPEPAVPEPAVPEPPVAESGETQASEPPSSDPSPLVDPLEAPLPAQWTAKELIAKRREEKGPIFACAFAFCCCCLCYERVEFVLDFICCKTCK